MQMSNSIGQLHTKNKGYLKGVYKVFTRCFRSICHFKHPLWYMKLLVTVGEMLMWHSECTQLLVRAPYLVAHGGRFWHFAPEVHENKKKRCRVIVLLGTMSVICTTHQFRVSEFFQVRGDFLQVMDPGCSIHGATLENDKMGVKSTTVTLTMTTNGR